MLVSLTRFNVIKGTSRDELYAVDKTVVAGCTKVGNLILDLNAIRNIISTELDEFSECAVTFKDGSTIGFTTKTTELAEIMTPQIAEAE